MIDQKKLHAALDFTVNRDNRDTVTRYIAIGNARREKLLDGSGELKPEYLAVIQTASALVSGGESPDAALKQASAAFTAPPNAYSEIYSEIMRP